MRGGAEDNLQVQVRQARVDSRDLNICLRGGLQALGALANN